MASERGWEFRVSWQRSGRARRSMVMQSRRGALEKAERLKRIDGELSGEIDWTPGPFDSEEHPLEGLPPLVTEPVVERRRVGEWEQIEGSWTRASAGVSQAHE